MKPYRFRTPAVLWLGIASLLIGCRPQDSSTNQSLEADGPPPIVEEKGQFLATVQLKEPALFATSRLDPASGQTMVDPKQAERIVAEQDAFERKLNHISPEIRVLYRYRMVLNGMTVVVPSKYENRFLNLAETSSLSVAEPQIIERAPFEVEDEPPRTSWGESTSVKFIQAVTLHQSMNLKGQGVKVGVIDTGIDYTHKMFGGPGTVDDYNNNDPATIDADFPTAKVVGGYDFVGARFDSGGESLAEQIPQPDPDPLDESGHGTHVAGTIAGHGDDVFTYDGVAPEASLFGLKVFGVNGSTNDAVVIAALDYAADPNGDLDPSDRLDVVNLSLGGGYGVPNTLYDLSIDNLSRGGVVAVISAGNSGDVPYIVGSPSTASSAISVAASVDNMDHNWRDPAIEIMLHDGRVVLEKLVAGSINPSPIGFAAKGVRSLYIGLAAEPLSEEVASLLAGKIALIDRGEVPFCEKAQRAVEGGAIGFVMINNVEGPAISMGGDCFVDIPGVMIEKAVGDQMKQSLEQGDVLVTLDSGEWIERPEVVDTITGFSSRGPRSIDGLLKPEITAPGAAIVSARVGGGGAGTRMSGTSMSAPHIAGVAALLKQRFPAETVASLKSRMMTTAVVIDDAQGVRYPVARQGAGRVDVAKAVATPLVFEPSSIALGQVDVDQGKTVLKTLTLSNTSDEQLSLSMNATDLSDELAISGPSRIVIPAQSQVRLPLRISFKPDIYRQQQRELEGFLRFERPGIDGEPEVMASLPVLAVLRRSSQLAAEELKVYASSAGEAPGALASLRIENPSESIGQIELFNLIGTDERKEGILTNPTRNNLCDLESAGYRLRDRWSEQGGWQTYLEIGIKLYYPVTTWNLCTIVLEFDKNLDGQADELLIDDRLQPADTSKPILFDPIVPVLQPKTNLLRLQHRDDTEVPLTEERNFALQEYSHSTLVIASLPLEEVASRNAAALAIKVSVYGRTGSPDSYDPLQVTEADSSWFEIPTQAMMQAWYELPSMIQVQPRDYAEINFAKGWGEGSLISYFPSNTSSQSIFRQDTQSHVSTPQYYP